MSKTKLKPIINTSVHSEIKLDHEKIRYSTTDKKKDLQFPKFLNSRLAEEIGIHFGDGFLSNKKSDYRVKGDKIKEREYYDQFIKLLYKDLFNLDLKIKEYSDTYGFEVYSQALSTFKINVLKIQPGKKDKITVPDLIKNNNRTIIASFLGGIFDTDCNINFQSKYNRESYYPIISIYQSSINLIDDLSFMLNKFNLEPLIYKDKKYPGSTIYLSGYERFFRFYKVIGFHNPKHLKKIENWKKRYPELIKNGEAIGRLEISHE